MSLVEWGFRSELPRGSSKVHGNPIFAFDPQLAGQAP